MMAERKRGKLINGKAGLYQLCEMIGRDMAEAGLHADAAEMNAETFEAIKKEMDAEGSRFRYSALLYGITIFINNDMENGKINIGRHERFAQKDKYRDIIEGLKDKLG